MKIKIDGKLYDPPGEDDALTLGEQSLLKREYGFVPAVNGIDLRDPDHISAFLFMTLRKRLPDAPANALITQIAAVKQLDFCNDDGSVLTEDQAQELADPTSAPSSGASSSESEPAAASS